MRSALVLLLLVALPASARAGLDAAWRALPERVTGDSIGTVLTDWEQRGAPGVRPGEAAYALGQFRYARGELEPAAGAFLRAATRLEGDARMAARYGWALATFALGRNTAARAAFEEVARVSSPLRPLAALGVAQCWDAEARPDRAFDVLRRLLAGSAGEAAPPALERYAALAARMHRDREALEARRRLVRLYPRSIEAARALETTEPGAAPPAAPGTGGPLHTDATPGRGRR